MPIGLGGGEGGNCKEFLGGVFASFLEGNFGVGFKGFRGVLGIRQIIYEICRVCRVCPVTVKIKLNCNF